MRILQPSSRRWQPILLLAVLFTVLGIAPGAAQTAPAVEAPQAPTATLHGTTAVDVTDFLATLSASSAGSQSGSGAAGMLPPAPEFLQTGTSCTSNSQCPPDKLCCRACAYPGCTLMQCLMPLNGHCPAIP
jgi:hypothetical protein